MTCSDDRDRRARRCAYMRQYYLRNPDKLEHKQSLCRVLMRKKREDPEYRANEKVKKELKRSKDEND